MSRFVSGCELELQISKPSGVGCSGTLFGRNSYSLQSFVFACEHLEIFPQLS